MNNNKRERINHLNLLFGFVLAVVLSACSSLPSKQDLPYTSRVKQAFDLATLGDQNMDARNFTQAMDYYRQALDMNSSIDYLPGIAESYLSMGMVNLATGDETSATRNFILARSIADQSGDKEIAAKVMANQGRMFIVFKHPQEATIFLESALLQYGVFDSTTAAIMLHNLGIAYYDLGKTAEATQCLFKALAVNGNKKNLKELASNHWALGTIYLSQNNHEAARSHFDAALSLDKQVENPDGVAQDLYALYVVTLKLDKPKDAYLYLSRSFNSSLSINDEASVKRDLSLLRDLALKTGQSGESSIWQTMLDQLNATPAPSATPTPQPSVKSSLTPSTTSPSPTKKKQP